MYFILHVYFTSCSSFQYQLFNVSFSHPILIFKSRGSVIFMSSLLFYLSFRCRRGAPGDRKVISRRRQSFLINIHNLVPCLTSLWGWFRGHSFWRWQFQHQRHVSYSKFWQYNIELQSVSTGCSDIHFPFLFSRMLAMPWTASVV
jgi:hypothetical protein